MVLWWKNALVLVIESDDVKLSREMNFIAKMRNDGLNEFGGQKGVGTEFDRIFSFKLKIKSLKITYGFLQKLNLKII